MIKVLFPISSYTNEGNSDIVSPTLLDVFNSQVGGRRQATGSSAHEVARFFGGVGHPLKQ